MSGGGEAVEEGAQRSPNVLVETAVTAGLFHPAHSASPQLSLILE